MSYDASGLVGFKNIYTDDPRGGVHLGEPLPLTVAKAVDESALFADAGAQALSDEEIHANAALIAAAPDLYEALVLAREYMRHSFGSRYDGPDPYPIIDAALSRARSSQ